MTNVVALERASAPTLEEYAARANLKYSESREAAETAAELMREGERTAFDCWIAIGEALVGAKGQIANGEWVRWLKENFEGSTAMAYHCMRMWDYRTELKEAGIATIRKANRFLGEEGLKRSASYYGADVEERREACKLVAAGVPEKEVAELLGRSRTAIRLWTDPDYHAEWKRRRQKREGHALKARRREENAGLAKKQPGAASEAYSLIRKALQLLERAERQAGRSTEREALHSAVGFMYKAEDEVGNALRRAARRPVPAHACSCAESMPDEDGSCVKCGRAAA